MQPSETVLAEYEGNDLGLVFTGRKAEIAVWSPSAARVRMNLFESDLEGKPYKVIELIIDSAGVWRASLDSIEYGTYYAFQAMFNGKWRAEVPGPYAKAVGRNGLRGHIIDPTLQNPDGWSDDVSPMLSAPSDILLYELHVRDFSIHPESGMNHKGKFLAFTERNTKTSDGTITGVDHLVALGVTHVHLLPAFDFLSIDEAKPELDQYNWGYDPQNYNVPEGSYASDASDGTVRIREFKAMVKALHDAGIRVVMDVVYNHTGSVDNMSFEELNPNYFYREWPDGKRSNASGCGNEVASERPMVRKFIIESLAYWMHEYHIDGFRFDLMAIHDMETMREVEKTLREIKSDVFIYGEGWTADESPLPEEMRALKKHINHLHGIAAFSDDIRDGIKGSWNKHESKGFVGGETDLRESVKFGIVGAIWHPQVDYSLVNNSKEPWAAEPVQCIGYVSCHDNHTLLDKLQISHPDALPDDLKKMHILSNTIVLTSQAVPFLHAGVEFMRSKGGVENSYKSPDDVNQIDWTLKESNKEVYESYLALVQLRKKHRAFKMGSAEEVRKRIQFIVTEPALIAYAINASGLDEWKEIVVVFNGEKQNATFQIESHLDDPNRTRKWKVAWYGDKPVTDDMQFADKVVVPGYGAVILFID